MTMTEVVPIIASFSHAEKLTLMQIILGQLMNEARASSQSSAQQDSLLDIIGIAEGEEAAVARHHDEHLYGAA